MGLEEEERQEDEDEDEEKHTEEHEEQEGWRMKRCKEREGRERKTRMERDAGVVMATSIHVHWAGGVLKRSPSHAAPYWSHGTTHLLLKVSLQT